MDRVNILEKSLEVKGNKVIKTAKEIKKKQKSLCLANFKDRKIISGKNSL